MTRALSLTACLLTTACAIQTTPPAVPEPAALPLVITETLASDEQICVARDPFHDPRLTCMTVGALRRLLRSHVDLSVEGAR